MTTTCTFLDFVEYGAKYTPDALISFTQLKEMLLGSRLSAEQSGDDGDWIDTRAAAGITMISERTLRDRATNGWTEVRSRRRGSVGGPWEWLQADCEKYAKRNQGRSALEVRGPKEAGLDAAQQIPVHTHVNNGTVAEAEAEAIRRYATGRR